MAEGRSQKIPLVDAHAHLDDLDDLSEALQEAKIEGVKGIIAVGVDVESNKRILKIGQENHGFVYPAIGYHPWQIRGEEVEANLSFIRDHIKESIAIGEIGLDYKIKVKKELQQRVFVDLLDMAHEFDKPVIIHCRFSHRQALEAVKAKGIRRAVFHWYSGPLDLLDVILNSGYFISATPALAYSPPHQEAIRRAPLEKILLETDSPVSYQGKESKPRDVRVTLENVAQIKEVGPVIVSGQTTLNASQLFQIPFVSEIS